MAEGVGAHALGRIAAGDWEAIDDDLARTFDDGLRGDDARFEGGEGCDRLKRGAGRVEALRGAVEEGCAGVAQERLAGRPERAGVEGRDADHGEDVARHGVESDDGAFAAAKGFACGRLDGGVDGEAHVVAAERLAEEFVAEGGEPAAPGSARQRRIVGEFDALRAVAGVEVAGDVGEGGVVEVAAPVGEGFDEDVAIAVEDAAAVRVVEAGKKARVAVFGGEAGIEHLPPGEGGEGGDEEGGRQHGEHAEAALEIRRGEHGVIVPPGSQRGRSDPAPPPDVPCAGQPRGRPRPRVAMMLRWISLVPE
ncbi:MAG: hypothetical protein WHT63_04175 [Tepidiforma sp.]